MGRLIAVFCTALVMACSPQPDAQASPAAEEAPQVNRHPESGLVIIPLTVETDEGVHNFEVELADTPEAQAQGYMFRTEIGDFEGMIFPSEVPQVRSFWMKNTPLPLDIIYIGEDNRILNIHAETTPYSTDSYYSLGKAAAVLELRGGRAAELGIEDGDLVMWEE